MGQITEHSELPEQKIIIRNYCKNPDELKAIRKISVRSSIFGEYIDRLLNMEIVADLLTAYFLEYEAESCFVAENEGRIIGYLLGSCDVQKMRTIIKGRIIPAIIKKAFQSKQIFRSQNLLLLKNIVNSYLKGEFKIPDFYPQYPATLHVNIAEGYRGRAVGTSLVKHFLIYLENKNINGIHFGVLSEKAKNFFLKLDFKILFSGEYTFLKYLSGETIPHYIMGMSNNDREEDPLTSF